MHVDSNHHRRSIHKVCSPEFRVVVVMCDLTSPPSSFYLEPAFRLVTIYDPFLVMVLVVRVPV